MSRKIAIIFAIAVAIEIAIAGTVCYIITKIG